MSVVNDDIFGKVRIKELEILGEKHRFPTRFYNFTRIAGIFPADAERVRELLPSTKLTPAQPKPDTALISLSAFEYREIDGLQPYNEFGVSIPVIYRQDPDKEGTPGNYSVDLPVTTEESMTGGIELWGFPKFLAEISFEDAGESRICRIRAEGKDILTLEVMKVATEYQTLDTYAYTVKDGELVKTHLEFRGEWGISDAKGGAVYVLGDHAMSDRLRWLGIGPISTGNTYGPKVNSLLHLPEFLPL